LNVAQLSNLSNSANEIAELDFFLRDVLWTYLEGFSGGFLIRIRSAPVSFNRRTPRKLPCSKPPFGIMVTVTLVRGPIGLANTVNTS
jgi:hypothetical protein